MAHLKRTESGSLLKYLGKFKAGLGAGGMMAILTEAIVSSRMWATLFPALSHPGVLVTALGAIVFAVVAINYPANSADD